MLVMRYFTDPPENESENFFLPCGTCSKRVGKRMRAVQCDLCNFWNHIKCDSIDPKYYEKLKIDPTIFHVCNICRNDLFPFHNLSNEHYHASVIHNIDVSDELNLEVTPDPIRNALFNDLNGLNEDQSGINCEYYDYSKIIPNLSTKKLLCFI